MIKNMSGGYGIAITGHPTPPYISPGSQSAGMLRYNTNSQQTEVYDGVSWLNMTSSPQVSLSNEVIEVVQWARKKMVQEQQLEKLMENHPGLRDTYEKFEIMKALCSKEEDNVPG